MEPTDIDEHILDELVRTESARTGAELRAEPIRRRTHQGSVNLEVALCGDGTRRELFLKWLRPEAEKRHQRARSGQQPPRLRPFPDPAERLRHEALALEIIERMVGDDDGTRWFAVPVAGLLQERTVLCLERIALPTFAACRRGNDSTLVAESATRLGAWLRAFHDQADLPHTRPHLDSVTLVVDFLAQLSGRIRDSGHARDADRIDRWTGDVARVLPSELPLRLGHGDFSPQNALVDAGGAVAVFDTAAEWRLPPHVDLAYFSVMLELEDMKRLTGGGRRAPSPAALMRRLCDGYGPTTPPRAELVVFEMLVLVDKWATLVDPDATDNRSDLRRRLRQAILTRRIRRAVRRRSVVVAADV